MAVRALCADGAAPTDVQPIDMTAIQLRTICPEPDAELSHTKLRISPAQAHLREWV